MRMQEMGSQKNKGTTKDKRGRSVVTTILVTIKLKLVSVTRRASHRPPVDSKEIFIHFFYKCIGCYTVM